MVLNQNLKTQLLDVSFKFWMWVSDNYGTLDLFVGIVSLFVIVSAAFSTNKRNNKTKPLSRKYLPQSIFIIKSVKDLDKVIISPPFVENKEIDIVPGKNRTWDDLKSEIDFTGFAPLDLSDDYRIYFITGTFGVGKSTFMLKQVDKCLANKKSTFKNIVFLNPFSSDRWFESLTNFDEPQKTLLVLDGLLRGQFEKDEFAKICKTIISLADGVTSEDNTSSVGPFKILITVRTDEFDELMRKELLCIQNLYKNYEITKYAHEGLKHIIRNYLKTYEVVFNVKDDNKDSLLNELISKSEGLPFYFRHFFITLYKNKEHLTEDKINDCPIGIVQLIWQTIKNRHYQPNDKVIPMLLLLFAKNNHFFSSYLIDFVFNKLANDQNKPIKRKLDSLKFYFQSIGRIVKEGRTPFVFYNLNSNWKTSILSIFKTEHNNHQGIQDVLEEYRQINDNEYDSLFREISQDLKNHLSRGLNNNMDYFLIVDLAKLSEDNLNIATDLYTEIRGSSNLKQEYFEFVKEELYQLWISYAWTYRSLHNKDRANECYESAFEKIGVRSNKKDISSYAYFLKKYILPDLKYGTKEYNECFQKTEETYKEAINLDENDKISWQTFGAFYKDLGEFEKAEKCFQEALKIDPDHIPSIQEYALFLKSRGKVEWVQNNERALKYYENAEEQFLRAKNLLEAGNNNFGKGEKEEFEKRLLNAYAKFLIDKTEWFREYKERIKINNEVDTILGNLLERYPKHGQSITVYARFLVGYARILPQYQNGQNLIKAEELLNNFLNSIEEEGNEQKDLSYFMSLHILANYLLKIKPSYMREEIPFIRAEELLEKSSKSFNSKHNSIALNELGKLYVHWANTYPINSDEYTKKMTMAAKSYEKAMEIIPENNETALHLSKVYFNYAFLLQYKNENPEYYINKAIEIAHEFAYVPFAHYYNLNSIGDEILKYGNIDQAKEIFTKASKLGVKLNINQSYSLFKLAQINEQQKRFKEALNLYYQSAKFQNTPEGYTAKRDSIKQMMSVNTLNDDLNKECLEKCMELSQNAYALDSNSWKNVLDYGEDLFRVGKFGDAISLLEKEATLFLDSPVSDEHLGVFYSLIWSCYKGSNNLPKVNMFYNKVLNTKSNTFGYIYIFRHFFKMEEFEKAAECFTEFLTAYFDAGDDQKEKLFKSMPNTFQKYAECLVKLDRIKEAGIIYKDYADLNYYQKYSEGARVYGMIGNKLLKVNMLDCAKYCFIKSLRMAQDNEMKAKNFSQLGFIYQKLEMWNEACICYSNAVNLRRNNSRDKNSLSYCTQKASYFINDNISEDIDSNTHKAVVFELNDDLDSAKSTYRKVLLSKTDSLDSGNAISKFRFIADALFSLGDRDFAIEVYTNQILQSVSGIEKIVVESVIWFIDKNEEDSSD